MTTLAKCKAAVKAGKVENPVIMHANGYVDRRGIDRGFIVCSESEADEYIFSQKIMFTKYEGKSNMNGYKESEKVATLSAPTKDLGPEFRACQMTHEIERCKAILRNPRATEFDRAVANQRYLELTTEQ